MSTFPPDSQQRASRWCGRKAIVFGGLVWFLALVDLVRFVRPDLLTSPDPLWAVPRLVLTLFVAGASAAAGALAAGGFFLWCRTPWSSAPLEPLPLNRSTLVLIGAAAFLFGTLVRFAWLDQIPPSVWFDEILPIQPSLALAGGWQDFRDAIRILPAGVSKNPSVGVLYLEGYRLVLRALGTNLFATRSVGALAGAISMVTAFFLARRLLPRGGGTLAVLALAGLRWQVLLARYGWNGLVLAPIVDLATICLIAARRRSSLFAALAGGVVAGIGAHVYLAAWIAAVALGGFLLWPAVGAPLWRRRFALAFLFGLGFLASASPIFLFRQGRASSYFGRASHQNLLLDYKRTKYWTIPFTVVADSFQAPWIVPEPDRRQDLPRSRLGWIVGIPVAVALLRAWRSPRDELSALFFSHAGAALAASLRWGFPGHPNGFRFLYLTTVTAVAAAAGALWLIGLFRPGGRRAAAMVALGLLAIASLLGARDALFGWGESRETFRVYWSDSTLVARSQLRWERYGRVSVDANVARIPFVVDTILQYRLDPEGERVRRLFFGSNPVSRDRGFCFRIAEASAAPRERERRVELLKDAWGEDHGAVFGRRCAPP